MNIIWKYLVLITLMIILDQLTKGAIQSSFVHGESINVISNFFNLTYVRNSGAAFGIGANANIYIRQFAFLFIPVLACFWLMYLIWIVRKSSVRLGLSYSLILAGAVGNLIDRFSYGYVVDFLDFYWKQSHFPAFNVADSCITIGGFILGIDFIIEFVQKKQNIKNEAYD